MECKSGEKSGSFHGAQLGSYGAQLFSGRTCSALVDNFHLIFSLNSVKQKENLKVLCLQTQLHID